MTEQIAPDTTADILEGDQAGAKAIRGGAAITASYVGGILVSLASVPFMIRQLGDVRYGQYVTASAFVLILGGITEGGLTNLGIREFAVRSPQARERLLRNLVGLRLVLTTVGVVIACGMAAATGADAVVVQGVAISGLGLLILMTQQTYMVPLNAGLRLGQVAVLGLVRQAILSLIVIGLAVANAGLVPFFWANVVMGVVLVAITMRLVRGTAPLLPAFHPAEWRTMLREVLPYAVATAVGLVYFRVGVILMSYLSTEAETGYFSAAFRVVEVLAALPWMLVSAAFPILARAAGGDEARFDLGLQKVFEVSTLVGSLLALGLGLGAPFAIGVIGGSGFDPSAAVLRILAIGLLTAFLMVTWTFALLSLKLFRQLVLANAAAAAVAVVGSVVLIPAWGARGAAAATVVAEATLALCCLAALRRARPSSRLDYGIVPKVLICAAPGLLAAVVLPLPSLVLAVVAGAIFVALAFALDAVPPEILEALAQRLPRTRS